MVVSKDSNLQTVVNLPRRPLASTAKTENAILVQIYPTGPEMGVRHALGSKTLVIGRDENCDIVIRDNSVSRRHAGIELGRDGEYLVKDLDSTNGTLLNQERIQCVPLKDGDYLNVGNSIFRYLSGNNVEALYHEEIYRLTIIDALTETHNKRYLLEYLDREIVRAVRHCRPLSLVMFDIDRFKTINDRLGHLAGDSILRELAHVVKRSVRRDELFARYGGEEFVLVLPENSTNEALVFAERIREDVEKNIFLFDNHEVPVTMSLGVSAMSGDFSVPSLELIRWADEALYEAKNSGRNRVCAYPLDGEAPVSRD